jgi:hypothetical protein
VTARAVALATLATVATACTAGAVVASAPGALEPAPAGLREEVVLAGALVGRNWLALNRFEDPRSPEAVLKAVEAAWSDRPAPIRRDSRAGWLTLVQAVDEGVEVLEVRAAPRGGSEGRRSRWQGLGPGADPSGAWLENILPAGSQVLQRLTHRDGGRLTTTLVALTGTSVPTAAGQVAAALERAGFARSSRAVPAFRGHGEAFFLVRRREEVAVTVSELDGRRAVVLHWGTPSP